MIVKCILNKLEKLDISSQEYLKEYIHLSEVDLIEGKEYVIYGITFWDDFPWLYVCEDDSDEYPRPHFSGFFKVIDAKVSSSWKVYYSQKEKKMTHILPEVWGDSLSFYENLVDGNEPEKIAFQELKMFIDKEIYS